MTDKQKLIDAFVDLKSGLKAFKDAMDRAEAAGLYCGVGFDFHQIEDGLWAVAEEAGLDEEVVYKDEL